jgi:hypothetical protein
MCACGAQKSCTQRLFIRDSSSYYTVLRGLEEHFGEAVDLDKLIIAIKADRGAMGLAEQWKKQGILVIPAFSTAQHVF